MTQPLREKYVEHCFRKGMKPVPAPARPNFNSTVDNQLLARKLR